MIRLVQLNRQLSTTLSRRKKDELQPSYDKRGFIRLFGFKGTKRNQFLSMRKANQRLFLPLLTTPLYIGNFWTLTFFFFDIFFGL